MKPLIIIAPVSDLYLSFGRGCANGYVAVPNDHLWYGKDYQDIDCDIHGGLTFSRPCNIFEQDWWMVGFDTAHWGDTADMWPLMEVWKEAVSLYEQAVDETVEIEGV